jgi:hypothetical protein
MTFPFIVRSLHHKAKDTDKYSRVIKYENETQNDAVHARKVRLTIALLFFFMILTACVMVYIAILLE